MGDIFSKIKFKKHRLHEDGVHGFYHLNEDRYVSVCSGGGSYGKLEKVEYWILLSNRHGEWFDNMKSTFEVAYVDGKSGELMSGPNGDVVKSECTPQVVEEIIEKIKQDENFG